MPTDDWQQAKQAWHTGADTLSHLATGLDQHSWQAVLALLDTCRGTIAVTGVGTSGIAARKIAHMLSCIECPALYLNATDAAHGDIGVLRPGDVLIMLSRGGNSEELTRLLPAVAQRGVQLISVTENSHSAIALAADHLLLLPVSREIDPLQMLATTSILVILAVFDAMIACLMVHRGYDKARLLAVHPGGNVGKTLRQPGP